MFRKLIAAFGLLLGAIAPAHAVDEVFVTEDGALRGYDVVHVHEPLVPVVGPAAATSDVAPVVATFHAWSDADRAYRAVRPLAARVLRGISVRVAVSAAARTTFWRIPFEYSRSKTSSLPFKPSFSNSSGIRLRSSCLLRPWSPP